MRPIHRTMALRPALSVMFTCAVVAGAAVAQDRPHGGGAGHGAAPGSAQPQGGHAHHGHHRQLTRALPHGSLSLQFGGRRHAYGGGVWFRPFGGRFVVTLPPFGIVLPLLPPVFSTTWLGGSPLYLADGVYYADAPGQGYWVVPPPDTEASPPPAAETAPPAAAPPEARVPRKALAAVDPVIYPRQGQTVAQTEIDRRDCNRWATTQPAAMADASVFQRAAEACMDGRGYTLR